VKNGKWKMENERSEPGHLKSGGVDNVKLKTLITNIPITNILKD